MDKRLAGILKYLLFLSIGILLLWYTYKDTDFSEIAGSLSRIRWEWAVASFCLGYLAIIIRGFRWNILLEPLGYRSDRWMNVHSVAFGYLMNDFVPRSGELARCGLLNRAEKIPIDKLFGTVILERIVDVLLLGVVVILSAFIHADAFQRLTNQIDGGKGKMLIYTAVAGIASLIIAYLFLKIFRNNKYIQRVIEFLRGVFNGIQSIVLLRQKTLFIIYSVGIWATWLVMTQCMMYALEETRGMGLGDTLFFVLAGSLGMLIPAPGGIGSYHYASTKGFEALGYSTQTGLTFAAISWAAKTLMEIVMGAIGFFIVTSVKMKKNNF
ncbi:MAG: flippase-like domain-containing protein [Crocinitomicaceae bacterium]|nr:flippase-like domain-containing protein [Crocinitomicaceae bacterium]